MVVQKKKLSCGKDSRHYVPCPAGQTFGSKLLILPHGKYNVCLQRLLIRRVSEMVVGEGFEPSKSMTADLQSAPFGRSGTPPLALLFFVKAGRIIPNVGTL